MSEHEKAGQPLTPTELREIGKRLFGKQWIKPMSLAVPISERYLHYFLKDERGMKRSTQERIRNLPQDAPPA